MQPSRRHYLEMEEIHDVIVVRFTRRKIATESEIRAIGEQLLNLVNQAGHRKIVVNFGEVQILATLLLGQLVAVHKRLRPLAGQLALCGIRQELMEPFQILNLDRLLTIYDTEPQALQRLLT